MYGSASVDNLTDYTFGGEIFSKYRGNKKKVPSAPSSVLYAPGGVDLIRKAGKAMI